MNLYSIASFLRCNNNINNNDCHNKNNHITTIGKHLISYTLSYNQWRTWFKISMFITLYTSWKIFHESIRTGMYYSEKKGFLIKCFFCVFVCVNIIIITFIFIFSLFHFIFLYINFSLYNDYPVQCHLTVTNDLTIVVWSSLSSSSWLLLLETENILDHLLFMWCHLRSIHIFTDGSLYFYLSIMYGCYFLNINITVNINIDIDINTQWSCQCR